MIVGFTGTQRGMTDAQRAWLARWIADHAPTQAHHGDCIGADAQFHEAIIAHANAATIVIHPPIDHSKRAFAPNADVMRPTKPYLERNHDIVNETDLLIAAPHTMRETLRSGTWATVRYARARRKPIVILLPNGSVIREGTTR